LKGTVPPLDAPPSSASFAVGDGDDADQDATGVEASLPADARVENAAASGADRGESLAKKKAGCGRALGTFRFQYQMNAAFAVNGFTGKDHAGFSHGSFGVGGGRPGDGAVALSDDGDGERT
jgi:hypothetical protein